jgi:hypothetical protein
MDTQRRQVPSPASGLGQAVELSHAVERAERSAEPREPGCGDAGIAKLREQKGV